MAMKRMSIFYLTKQKRVKDLTKQMQTIEVDYQRKKLKKIIQQRKNKWKELNSNKSIEQPDFNHLKKQYHQFSFVQSNASHQPFVSQKIKRKVKSSDREYSSSANMKVGNPISLTKINSQIDSNKITNLKFLQYDRTIDQQSGQKKKSLLQNTKFKSLFSRDKFIKFKKTYFQKFIPDKFNFYTPQQEYKSIKTTMSKSQTDRQMKSRLQYSKIKRISSTTETQINNHQRSLQLDNAFLNKSRLKKSRVNQMITSKSKQNLKSRIKSLNSQKIMPVSMQKNLNSLQY